MVCFGKDLVGFGKFGRFSGALLGVGSGLKRIEVAFCVVSKVFRHEEIELLFAVARVASWSV